MLLFMNYENLNEKKLIYFKKYPSASSNLRNENVCESDKKIISHS